MSDTDIEIRTEAETDFRNNIEYKTKTEIKSSVNRVSCGNVEVAKALTRLVHRTLATGNETEIHVTCRDSGQVHRVIITRKGKFVCNIAQDSDCVRVVCG